MEAGALPRPGRIPVAKSRRLLLARSDERLVEHVRRGNEVAFEVLYDRHSRGILSFCRHMLGAPEEAEDAVQHTFLAAYNDLVASDRPIKLKAWLYTIARNRCLSMLRARREHAVEEIEVSTTGLAEQVQQRHELRELLADMRRLPDEQRAALVLAELRDLSHTDIGDVLGVEPVKVKSLVFQARSTLIEYREARTIPCIEIREQLSTLRGGALRRGPLRKHLSTCDGCRAFRDDVRRQRVMMAAVLPVIPTVGLKNSALAAIGGGIGGGGAAAAGGAAAGGGIFSGLGSASIVAKTVVALAVGGAAVGGGVAIEKTATQHSSPPSSPPSSVEQGTTHRSSVAADHAQGPPGTSAITDHGRAGTAPHGVARRVRAHGSPATKHHGNPNASTLGGPTASHGHNNAGTTHGHSGGGGKSSSGTKPDHTSQGHQQDTTKHTGGKGHQTTAPTTTDTTTTTTPATTPPAVPHGNAHIRTPKPPKPPKSPTATDTTSTTPTLP